jgi:hypothetical protein
MIKEMTLHWRELEKTFKNFDKRVRDSDCNSYTIRYKIQQVQAL